ncbi:MAG: hypothetical protein B7Z15_01775 [Rhizobiales bacterium 32-66-8]|nr:MAG: hypothetical protein B7Z15_01775 [Rhizobiales bacterium 32-66-8]
MANAHVTDLVAKVIYEQSYGRVWEDATKWARRDSMICAETIVSRLGDAQMLADAPAADAAPPCTARPLSGRH